MNVDPSLENNLIEVELLDSLPGNPRRGNLEAIKASYESFGQVKPIIAVANGDRYTVIAGNHQLAAVKELGWSHMAVVVKDWDHDKAVAFALADNRTSEMGHTDDEALFDMMSSVVDFDDPLWENLGWDEFEYALIESNHLEDQVDHQDFSGGYLPPVLVGTEVPDSPPNERPDTPIHKDEDTGDLEFDGDEETTNEVVTSGAGAIGSAGAKTVVQYTLVFDNVAQQQRWYDFLRLIKNENGPYHDMPSTAAQVLAYLDDHKGELF